MLQYVIPHNVVSRKVGPDDLANVLKWGIEMYEMCTKPAGVHEHGALAIAHSQVTCIDPLRFFVTRDGELIINPVITRHTEVKVSREEGCMSYPHRHATKTWRFNKIEVQYQTIDDSKLDWTNDLKLITRQESARGQRAAMWQHEIDHMDAVYVFPDDPVDMIGGKVL